MAELRGINTFLSLIGFLSAAALPVVLAFLGGDRVSQKGSDVAYIGTLAVLSAAFGWLLFWIQRLRKRNETAMDFPAAAYATLVVPVVCLLLVLTVTLRLSLTGYLLSVLLVHLGFLFVGRFGRRWASTAVFAGWNRLVIRLTPLLYGGIFWIWFGVHYQPHFGMRSFLLLSALAAAFSTFAGFDRLRAFRLRLRNHWWIYLLLGIFLAATLYQPEIFFDRAHSNPLLAPMADVMNGRTVFVDSMSQYGVGIVYFLLAVLSFFRLPVFYPGLGVVVDVLYFLQFAAIFLILHRATKSFFLSLAGLGAILYFSFYATCWPSLLRIPAQGPLRYGWTYLVLAAGWLGLRRQGRRWRILELAILGAASVWNAEAFLFTFIPSSVLHFLADVLFSRDRTSGLAVFTKRVLLQTAVVVFCWAVWWVASLTASGSPPNLAYYFDVFARFTSLGGEGSPLDFHSFWTGAVAAVFLGSILAAVYAGWRRSDRIAADTAALLSGLSAAGLLQYLYYFVYDYDAHLALLCPPLLMVITLWIALTQNAGSARAFPRLTGWIFGSTVVVSVWLCMAQVAPWFQNGIHKSFLYQMVMDLPAGDAVTFADPYRFAPTNETVAAFVELTERYAAGDRSIALFAFHEDQTEVLLLTGKTHLLELTDPVMCSVSSSFSEHVLKLADRYAGVPEYIFYDSSESALLDIQQEAFNRLVSAAEYTVIDRLGNVLVYRKD